MFNVTNSFEFYGMLVQDYDEFFVEQSSSRRAIHCALTAYHLREWVWKDWLHADEAIKTKLGITDKDSFNGWVNSACPWFPTVRELANGSKHLQEQGIKTSLVSGYGQGPYGVGPYGKGYLLIDHGEEALEHRWQPAMHLLEAVVRFWRDFLKLYRSDKTIPESAHHLDTQ